MAAEGVCPFPLPPAQYCKVYTDENVEKQLVPDPPTPAEEAYTMFGASFKVLPFITEYCFTEKRVYSNLLNYDRYNQVLHPNIYNFMVINGVLSSYSFVLETNLSFDRLSVLSSPLRLCLSPNIAFSF